MSEMLDYELALADPRELPKETLDKLGHKAKPLLKIIRDNCRDCSGSRVKAKVCCNFNCKLWPYRMATNPFRSARKSEAMQKVTQEGAERFRAMHAKKGG